MSTVRVEPSGIEFTVEPGETIFEAAHRHGYFWPTVCGGQGTCRTCVLSVVEGAEALSPIEAWEREGLSEVVPTLAGPPESFRMACQVKAEADVVVHKVGVRKN
jgi:2Fe-2S ferredoxin